MLVCARSENHPRSLQYFCSSRAPPQRFLEGFVPLRRRANASVVRGSPGHCDAFFVPIQNFARDAEWRLPTLSCHGGLWASLRYPVQGDRLPIAADSTARHLAPSLIVECTFPMSGPLSLFLIWSMMLDLVVLDQDSISLFSPLRAVGVDAPF